MEGATAGAKRCFEVLTGKRCARFTECGCHSSARGSIAFQSVNFVTQATDTFLRDIDLRIEPNQIVGWLAAPARAKTR